MPYAFDDFHALIHRLNRPISARDPLVRYLCALVSELAYYHVPKFEIDHKKRAKIVPCKQYVKICQSGTPTNILRFTERAEFTNSFVVEDRGVVAVGIMVKNFLFLGFRGTLFLYDWKINLRSSMIELTSPSWHDIRGLSWYDSMGGSRAHRGLTEESIRIYWKIFDVLQKNRIADYTHIFLTGHSLGGAVAAIVERFFPLIPTSACLFGSPRYCNASAYYSALKKPPIQIQRVGDIVPALPPRKMGYADHPYQFDTSGDLVREPIGGSGLSHFIWCLALFLGKRLAPHRMESYRQEIGADVGSEFSHKMLIPCDQVRV